MRVLHLAGADDWEAARRRGTWTGSARGLDLADVGFVHACTAGQLPWVAARFHADDVRRLVVLVLDVPTLEAAGSPVRWEAVGDAPGRFPHVYGPVPVRAVVAALPAAVVGGELVTPDLSGWDADGRGRPSTPGASAGGPTGPRPDP